MIEMQLQHERNPYLRGSRKRTSQNGTEKDKGSEVVENTIKS